MVTRKSPRRDRADAPGRPDRGRGPRPDRGRAPARASRPPTSTRSPRRTSGPPARSRRSRATRGSTRAGRSRPASASRSTTRSSTASPASGRIRDGQIVSVDAGAIVDGWHGDGGADLLRRRRRRARSRQLIDLTRAAMLAGIAAAVPGNHIERHLGGRRGRRRAAPGSASSASSSGHGIGTAMHEEPQVPNYRTGRPGRKLEPGLCLAIEPMFTLGGHDTRILRRRLDGRHRRRLAGGPFRAHHRRHRGRPADPDPVA